MHRKNDDSAELSSKFVTLFVLCFIESATWLRMLQDDVQVSEMMTFVGVGEYEKRLFFAFHFCFRVLKKTHKSILRVPFLRE